MSHDQDTGNLNFHELLAQSDPMLAQLLEFSPDATFIFDNQRRVVFANSHANKIFGFAENAAIGMDVRQLIPQRFHEAHAGHESQYMHHPTRRPMGRGDADLVALRSDGSEFSVDVSLSPLTTEHGTWIVAAVRDVTARKESQAKIKKYAAELERSNKELESFAHVAAHDLGAPLRRVGMVCQLIRDEYSDKLDESGEEFLQILVDSVHEMQQLMKELLAHSKVGAQGLEFQPVDVATVIDKVLLDCSDAIEKHGVQIECCNLPTIHADRVSFGRLMQNLVGNAIHYRSQDPPVIQIEANEEDCQWKFRIKDNGIGIDPQYHEVIFDIFRRLHGDRISGTGIGLATCKKIVELHGGEIWVESQPNQGSTFCFTIPITS